jgi:predicted HTH domain antitoxin
MRLFSAKESYQDGSDMLKAQDFVDARLYDSEDDVIQDALRHLLRSRADLRVKLAIHRYQSDEISLAKAAHLAGVSWAQMKDILLERGVQPRLGPETLEDAQQEVEVLRKHLETRS